LSVIKRLIRGNNIDWIGEYEKLLKYFLWMITSKTDQGNMYNPYDLKNYGREKNL